MAISPAAAIYKNKEFLAAIKSRVDQFIALTKLNHDLLYQQFFQLASVAHEMKPDLIIELGRAYGNSTFVLTEVANHINAKVVSLCNNNFWEELTLPKIQSLINAEWLEHLDARFIENFVAVELEKEIKDAKRVFIFWDAHGFQTAEYVLGYLLPLMKNKDCVIVMDDVTDMRYQYVPDSYENQRIWRSASANEGNSRVRLGNFCSANEQLISVLDFCSRNHLELKSADESYALELSEEMKKGLKKDLGKAFSTEAHWVYLHIDGTKNFDKLFFPKFDREAILLERGIQKSAPTTESSKSNSIFQRISDLF